MKQKPKKKNIYLLLIFFVLLSLTPTFFYFYKSSSNQTVPKETEEVLERLNKLISQSKFNPEKAVQELESLTHLPEYTAYKKNYILARLYEKLGKNHKAIELYKDLLNKNYPLKERVIFHFANLNAKIGNDGVALKHFNKLLHDFPNSKSVPQTKYYLAQTNLRLKHTSQAINTLRSLKSEFSNTQYGIAANYYLGEYEYHKKKYKQALSFWREYLKNSPDGRFASEIADFYSKIEKENSLELTPGDFSLLGDVFYHKKDYAKSAKYYLHDDNPEKYYNLAYSLYRTYQRNEAKEYFKAFVYRYPNSKDAKLALFYAADCIPYSSRKNWFEQIIKDIPEFADYSYYKIAQLERNKNKQEKLLKKFIKKFPTSDFTLDVIWELMWQKIEDKQYKNAFEIGKEYFNKFKNTKLEKNDTRAKIGFFLGKIAELNNQVEEAKEYYKEVKNLLKDNYYSFRAGHRLSALNGGLDPLWRQQNQNSIFSDFYWKMPLVTSLNKIKDKYGSTIYELIRLQQFDEAIELIGNNESPSKTITAWLKALNEEYETSINLATELARNYTDVFKSPIWELAYPLHYFEHILNTCKSYNNIDPLLVCGIIRQESRFEKDAISISNAIGLMQLIPSTASTVARQVNVNLYSLDLLHNPKTNVKLGTHYLSNLLSEFTNPLFAVASYNAGPTAVKRWIASNNYPDLDFFIESIPYFQTRDYVKKVYASYWMYVWLYSDITNA